MMIDHDPVIWEMIDQVRDVVYDTTYKPGYTISCHPQFDKESGYWIKIQLDTPPVQDVRTGAPMTLTQHRLFPLMTLDTPSTIKRPIFQVVKEWELHELMEWLRFDGNLILPSEELHNSIGDVYDVKDPVDIEKLGVYDALKIYGYGALQ